MESSTLEADRYLSAWLHFLINLIFTTRVILTSLWSEIKEDQPVFFKSLPPNVQDELRCMRLLSFVSYIYN
jgi:hypothetical protein